MNSALDRLRDKVPLQPFLGHLAILDHGHCQNKLSKIETLRLAKNYIKLLSAFLTTNEKLKFEDLHRILSRNLSQTTANILRVRLAYDLDYSIARTVLEDCEGGTSSVNDEFDSNDGHHWNQDEDHCYNDYLQMNSYYGCCYK